MIDAHECLTSSHENLKMITAQLLQAYSLRELQLRLRRIRRAKVPEKTLRRWLNETGIGTKSEYTEKDYETLARLCVHYKQGKSLRQFQELLIQEIKQNGNY